MASRAARKREMIAKLEDEEYINALVEESYAAKVQSVRACQATLHKRREGMKPSMQNRYKQRSMKLR